MLVLYMAPGCVVPIFSLRLQELGFSSVAIGWCCASQAIGTMLAPLIAGQIADRWLSAERCLALCSFITAGLLWFAAGLTSPLAMFWVSVAGWLVMAPTFTLGSAVCLSQLKDARQEFGRIRVWGTIGWIIPAWILGFWLADGSICRSVLNWVRPERPAPELADAFRLAAIFAVVFGLYSLTLPGTIPQSSTKGSAPLAAIRLLNCRPMIVYAICTLGISAALPFSTQISPLLLEQLEVPRQWIPRTLTLAQLSEIASLFLLPRILGALGLRGSMRLGLASAALTLAGLAAGRPLALVLAGLSLYGLCIGCYLIAGQMYVNQQSSPHMRASAQAVHSVLCGIGLFIGNIFVGEVRDWVSGDLRTTIAVGSLLALAITIFFVSGFPRLSARQSIAGLN
jgi:MFS family permease